MEKAKDLHINHVVVASSQGRTAKKLIGHDLQVVCVTLHNGYNKPGENIMPHSQRKELEDAGIKVLTTTHLLAGIDRGLSIKYGGIYPPEIIADTLRMFGEGLKVCVEITTMALDAGLIPYGQAVVAIAGSGRGADTALVIMPEHSNQFMSTRIKEIICKF